MSLSTEHRGYAIHFNEDKETWSCSGLGLQDCASLKTMKRAIDEHLKSDRRVDIMALRISRDSRNDARKLTEVRITVLCEPFNSRFGGRGGIEDCWVSDGKSKWKESIERLYPLDARPGLEHYLKRLSEADKLSEIVSKEFAQIESYSAAKLLKAAGKSKPRKKQ